MQQQQQKNYVATPVDYPTRRVYKQTFQKDAAEKEMLRTLKHTNKTLIKQEFGSIPKKVLNPSTKQIGTIKMNF